MLSSIGLYELGIGSAIICLVVVVFVFLWLELVKAIPDEVDQEENRLWQERCKEIAGAYQACEAEKGDCECKKAEVLRQAAKPSVN
jgi:hypothetical protein